MQKEIHRGVSCFMTAPYHHHDKKGSSLCGVFTGMWLDQLPHGHGSYEFTETKGRVEVSGLAVGDFSHGLLHGKGCITFASGVWNSGHQQLILRGIQLCMRNKGCLLLLFSNGMLWVLC